MNIFPDATHKAHEFARPQNIIIKLKEEHHWMAVIASEYLN